MSVNWNVWESVSRANYACIVCKDRRPRAQKNLFEHEQTVKHRRALKRFITPQNEQDTLPSKIAEITAAVLRQPDAPSSSPIVQSMPTGNLYAYLDNHDISNSNSFMDEEPQTFAPWVDAIFDGDFEIQPRLQYEELQEDDEIRGVFDESSSDTDPAIEMEHLSSDSDEDTVSDELAPPEKRQRAQFKPSALWYPWVDKITCTMDILMHLNRSVFSQRQLDLFLWLLSTNGVDDLPSVKTMKSMDKHLQDLCGIESIRYKGSLGHVYYVNSLSQILSQEMANPRVRPHLHFYPEDTGSTVNETWQANHWLREADSSLLTPMARVKNQDFYIYEPTLLADSSLCIPTRWFLRKGSIYAKAWRLIPFPLSQAWIVRTYETFEVSENELMLSFPLLKDSWQRYIRYDPTFVLGCQTLSTSGTLLPWTLSVLSVGNRWRALAEGARVYSFPIWLYCDDTSGNLSKKWNKHNSFLFTAAGLPLSKVHEEYNVHFLCTSNCAPPLEMMEGIEIQIRQCQDVGVWAYDCVHKEAVLLVPFVYALLGDNPMQSELASHIGLRGKFFCRICLVKGSDAEVVKKKTANTNSAAKTSTRLDETHDNSDSDSVMSFASDGSNANVAETASAKKKGGKKPESFTQMFERILRFMKIGEQRKKEDTIGTLRQIYHYYRTAGGKGLGDKLKTEKGVKDTFQEFFLNKISSALKNKRTVDGKNAALETCLKDLPLDPLNPVLRLHGIDPHLHTPVEILHVLLLGVLKYLWRDVMQHQIKNDESKKQILESRLNSLNTEGLYVTRITGHTLVQYAGSLTGRDFRLISQIAIYVLYDLVTPECYAAWVSLTKLIPLVFQPCISDITTHTENLAVAIQEFMMLIAQWTPRWFNKPKYHILLHLVEHIRRFGPAILFATENFESHNAIIRAKSVHSNRHAPSMDIARQFAQYNRIRHLLSGGPLRLNISSDDTAGEKNAQNHAAFVGSDSILINAGKAGLWRPVGKGPLSLLAEDSIIKSYLGIKKDSKGSPYSGVTCVHDKSAPSLYSATNTGRVFVNALRASERVQSCVSVNVNEVDKVKVGSWVLARHAAAPQPSVARVDQILKVLRHFELQDRLSVILLCRLANVQESESLTKMPRIRITENMGVFSAEDIICIVNTQHDCSSNNCDLSAHRFVQEERERTDRTESTVHHFNADDLLLNLAQMRNSFHLQHFRTFPGALKEPHFSQSVRLAVEQEIIRNKNSSAAQRPAQHSTSRNAASTRLNLPIQRIHELRGQ